MTRQIVEEEFPFRHLPKIRHFVIVEANHERRDEIEFFSEIGERVKGPDLLDYSPDAEQPCQFTKHRQPIHVEA